MAASANAGKVVVNYLLAFTDGAENSSKTSAAVLGDELRNANLSNFHFTTIAAGINGSDR